ncbi:MAG: NAD(P)-dependent oxidoreductase [Lachnospiraceae bacterium]|nr:NAD(P)-dependent oxidoreductase [Lachnospiraceae bacterium]
MRAVLTGAAGFAGCNLLEALLDSGWETIAVLREDSPHNERLETDSMRDFEKKGQLIKVYCDMSRILTLRTHVSGDADVFFNLAWHGKSRDDFDSQYSNIDEAIHAMEAAKSLSCKVFLMTGSQAEYGIKRDLETEDSVLMPENAYGAAKAAAMHVLKAKARKIGMSFVWARIFSLYGKYEHESTLISYLIRELKSGRSPSVSAATQEWDYLFARDAAEAMIALSLKGRDGEAYNLANGNFRPLRGFIEDVRIVVAPEVKITYGYPISNAVELRPSVRKLFRDTLWTPATEFTEGIRQIVYEE